MSTRQNEKEQKKTSGKCEVRGKCPADQWSAVISLPRPWVQLLLGELKPHKLHGAANVMSKREENVSRYSYC